MYRWRRENFLQPYAGNMDPLRALAPDGVNAAVSLSPYDFMVPQARQPESLSQVTPAGAAAWRQKFAGDATLAIAQRAEQDTSKAFALRPDLPDLQRLHLAADATVSLTQLFREYHLALVDATSGRNTTDLAERQHLADGAREHLKQAVRHAIDYAVAMRSVTLSDLRPSLARFRLDVERLYVGTTLCLVREAAFQFDQEFGGESVTAFFDGLIAPAADRLRE
jgi:uncharacterized protein (DUF1501 family)